MSNNNTNDNDNDNNNNNNNDSSRFCFGAGDCIGSKEVIAIRKND